MLEPFVYKSVSVIGLGYIGLPTAAAFAKRGTPVIGVDVNRKAVETINSGRIHIVEPGLGEVVHSAVEDGLLRAVLEPVPADAFLIAVPTPFKGENHEPDLAFIKAAVGAIAPVLKAGNLVVLESTSPVGTTEQLAEWLAQARPDLSFPQQQGERSDIRIAYCPERVLPGRMVEELVSNDRVIGGLTQRCGLAAKALYEIFVEGECVLSDARTAELCKLAENAFRDVNIAFANELSLICDGQGIDVWQLIRLANRHPRVSILQPSAGVGGHCIAVDPWFIVAGAPDKARLVRTAREVNDHKPDWVISKVQDAVAEFANRHRNVKPVIAALGLAFKPNIDDLRESPALHIAEELYRLHGERLMLVEPHAEELPQFLSGCRMATLEDALNEADVLVLLVKHDAFLVTVEENIRPQQMIIDAVGLIESNGPAFYATPEHHSAKAAE